MRFILCLALFAALCFAQNGTWQKPGEIQQPKGHWQVPGDIQVPKGIQDIKVEQESCQHRLTVGADALFEFNKATLTDDAATTLEALGPLIRREGNHPIRIEGHTDSMGSAAYNQTLSEKRAQAVKDWLVTHDFVPASTQIQGFGKSRPAAPNTNPDGSDNPQGRQQNRRVEVIVDTCR